MREGKRHGRGAAGKVCKLPNMVAHSKKNSRSRHRWRGLLDAALSLQCKATLLVVAVTGGMTALASGYLVQSSVHVLRENRDAEVSRLAGMLARLAAEPLAECDLGALASMARDGVSSVPLAYLVVFDANNHLMAEEWHPSMVTHTETIRRFLSDPAVPGTPVYRPAVGSVPPILEVAYPVQQRSEGADAPPERAGQLLGYVRAGLVARGWHETLASKLDLLVGVGTIAIVMAIPLGFLVIRRIMAPLADLQDVMWRFSHGDMHVRSRVERRDEIGRLSHSFNRMADLHQHTHERIVRLNADLEQRVAQRTQQLRELAARESLTGLYNRRYFGEMLERCFAEAARYHHDLSCVMIDLDNFKAANDTYGHHVGDELLIIMAATITSQLRSSDVPARYGGDEFVLLLPQTGADRAYVLAERIMERFTAETAERFPRIGVGMSVGIASLEWAEAEHAAALIRAADRSLYQAKAAGKNRIVVAGTQREPAPQ